LIFKPKPAPAPVTCKIEDSVNDIGMTTHDFKVVWILDGVNCEKIQEVTSALKLRSYTSKTCIANSHSTLTIVDVDPADAGKMSEALAGLFPDVKPKCA
jgi:hypothetical protein